jgi:hypothetical protein
MFGRVFQVADERLPWLAETKKPVSLLILLRRSTISIASLTMRSMYWFLVVRTRYYEIECGVPSRHRVPPRLACLHLQDGCLVPLMHLQPGVHGTVSLSNVDLDALTGDSVYTRCPVSQVIFDLPKERRYVLGRQAHWFDVVLGQHSAESVEYRLAVPWTPDWRSISGTSVLNIQTREPWRNTASTWNTASNFIIPPPSPLRPDTRVASLGRPLNLSSVSTIWTERWDFVSASHGSLSSATPKTLPNMTPDLEGYAGHTRSAVQTRGYWVNAPSATVPRPHPDRT